VSARRPIKSWSGGHEGESLFIEVSQTCEEFKNLQRRGYSLIGCGVGRKQTCGKDEMCTNSVGSRAREKEYIKGVHHFGPRYRESIK